DLDEIRGDSHIDDGASDMDITGDLANDVANDVDVEVDIDIPDDSPDSPDTELSDEMSNPDDQSEVPDVVDVTDMDVNCDGVAFAVAVTDWMLTEGLDEGPLDIEVDLGSLPTSEGRVTFKRAPDSVRTFATPVN